MKRDRLVWFAAGAAISAFASIGASLLVASSKEPKWILRLDENGQSLLGPEKGAKWRGAEIARNCGVRSFKMTPAAGADGKDGTEIPLSKENNPSLGCVIEEARKAGLWVGVDMV